jgi:hypothetical protein
MGSLLFGLVAGSGLTWVFMELRRDGYWREFSTRRRGSNPPPPSRKPAPPAGPPDVCWMRSFTHECTNPPTGAPPLKLRRKEAPPAGPSEQPLPGRKPAPPAEPPEQPLTAQLIRYWAWEQEQVRRAWLDDPIRFDEGQTQRGHGNGGPTTPKPPIKPQFHGGYQPRPSNRTPNPPPSEP